MIFRTLIFISVALLNIGNAAAQSIPVIPKERLDSAANPKAIPGSPILFESSVMDIGTVNEDDQPATVSFIYKNIGNQPFSIEEVATGCDCTGVEFPEKEIKPGERGEIRVTYYPKGHPGSFSRKMEVFINLYPDDIAAVLTLKGKVLPSAYPTHDYPVAIDRLLLKRKEVEIKSGRKAIESIEVMNAGDTPLTISADKNLLPPSIRFQSEPQELKPGEIGNLEIIYTPDPTQTRLPQRLPIILNGLNGPSTLRTIYVKIIDSGN